MLTTADGMPIWESGAATCYGFKQGNTVFRVIVTVVAQWTADGRIRLIQYTEHATRANNAANHLSWKGRTFARPTDAKDAEYFDSVVRLLTQSKFEPKPATIEERLTP